MRLVRSLSLAVLVAAAAAPTAFAQVVAVSITVAPPVLPVYEQPPIPAVGYIWTPGYWAYGDGGYFWVPGTWVRPPSVGLLWTPGYWGWSNGVYAWNAGYWGPHVGFYGGVNYGYGYVGTGYAGGYWRAGVFSYNSTVNNFGSVSISNTYNKTVINNTNITRVSFNGGTGGTAARPTPQELAASKEQHTPATAVQTQHQQAASTNKDLHASVNHGNPAVAATSNPGQFSGHGVVPAKSAVNGAAGTGHDATAAHPGTAAAPAAAGAAAHAVGHSTPDAAHAVPAHGGTATPAANAARSNAAPKPAPATANAAAHAATSSNQIGRSQPARGQMGPGTAHAATARVAARPRPAPAPHPGKPGHQ